MQPMNSRHIPPKQLCFKAGAFCLAFSLALSNAYATQKNPDKNPKKTTTTKVHPIRSDAEPDSIQYGSRADVMAFATKLSERQNWPPEWAKHALREAKYLPSVAQLIMPPTNGTAKNWATYRGRFIEPKRIAAGKKFWLAHADSLEQAEKRWGVPAELIVGIIGVETLYGRHTGNFRVLDALATLSFDFPAGRSDRSAFFATELEQFLIWCHQEQYEPASIKGSYAGAIGLAQFMPSSINRFATDFDQNGHIDLTTSPADAIGSVARYISAHGWESGLPTHYAVTPPAPGSDLQILLQPDIKPSFSAIEMAERGAKLDAQGQLHSGMLALVELENGPDAPKSYIAGTQNFYTVTRYNWSSYYALAVIELGQAVRKAVESAF
jgi:membrane-bound lytic murein transglycosylase B